MPTTYDQRQEAWVGKIAGRIKDSKAAGEDKKNRDAGRQAIAEAPRR